MIFVKRYAPPSVCIDEILRYAAAKEGGEDTRALAQVCLDEAEKVLSYHVCYCELPLTRVNETLDLSFCTMGSATLGKALDGCDRFILFAATLGLGYDRLLSRYSRLSPAKAWMMQAIGAERIESLCDCFCREINDEYVKKGMRVKPRVSPGYGDIPLTMQKEIFAALDCSRKIGLSLNESLIMTPTKSVTAIAGLLEGEKHGHS